MDRREATERLMRILIDQLQIEETRAWYLADRMYRDVVKPSVEDKEDEYVRLMNVTRDPRAGN